MNNNHTPREQLKRKVIEAIHGLPYDEVSENKGNGSFVEVCGKLIRPITIGRVMAALATLKEYYSFSNGQIVLDNHDLYGLFIAKWKLTKENRQEATDEDQTDETIEALLKLFTP